MSASIVSNTTMSVCSATVAWDSPEIAQRRLQLNRAASSEQKKPNSGVHIRMSADRLRDTRGRQEYESRREEREEKKDGGSGPAMQPTDRTGHGQVPRSGTNERYASMRRKVANHPRRRATRRWGNQFKLNQQTPEAEAKIAALPLEKREGNVVGTYLRAVSMRKGKELREKGTTHPREEENEEGVW
jgi:hypothetical protein